jgi:RNA polymerase sigma-70 factor (ECF subfamily)
VTLLHEDAIQSMPPYAMWIQGAHDIVTWMVQPGPSECRGSRLVATRANGCPAFGQYKPDPAGGYAPWALHVIESSAGRIAAISSFLDVERIFPTFGLPAQLPPEADQIQQVTQG